LFPSHDHQAGEQLADKLFIVAERDFNHMPEMRMLKSFITVEPPLAHVCAELTDRYYVDQELTKALNEPLIGLFDGQSRPTPDFKYNASSFGPSTD